MKKTIAVKLTNVSKKYQLLHEKPTLIEKLVTRKSSQNFWALKDINLEIYKGEKVGIIGSNGAGKTTLLQIIAGITTPTTGKVETQGKVISIIDISAGFHPDMTGNDNILVNGMLLGMTKAETVSKKPSIIKFANIGKFIYAPVHTYSSGMKLRLGFSIAIHSDPDILILDEGFSAGDEFFQKKVDLKIKQLFNSKKTIIFASHWLEYLSHNCDRIITLKTSKIIDDNDASSAIKAYKKLKQL